MEYDNDFDEERQTDFDMDIPEDRLAYDKRYVRKLRDLTDSMDKDSEGEIIDELQGLRYDPSNSPENDAELNYLKSTNVIRQKSKLNDSTKSYLQEIARRDGRKFSDVHREYRKMIKKGGLK